MLRLNTYALVKFYIIPIFILSAVRALWEMKVSENPSYFFFSKFWFYSLLFYTEVIIAERLNKILVISTIVSLLVFAISTVLDGILWIRSYDRGLPIHNLAASVVSFFVFGTGIPKISLILSFALRFAFLILFIATKRVSVFYAFVSFLTVYALWSAFHIDIVYGRIKVFDTILHEKIDISCVLSGIVYFSLFLLLYLRREKSNLEKDFNAYTIAYLFILSLLGYASSGQQGYIKTVKAALDILPFYLTSFVFRRIGKVQDHNSKSVKDLIILVAVIASILAQSRGIFAVVLVFIMPIFAVYYLPPLQIQNTFFGVLIYSIFSGLLFVISYLSLKATFSIAREASAIALNIILFSFFSKVSENVSNLTVRRIFNVLVCFTPLILLRSVSDIILSAGVGIISAIFPKSNIPKLVLALYFALRYIYLKERLPRIPL